MQPTKTNAQDMILNIGAFQLPLCTGVSSEGDMNRKSCDSFHKLPCCTVLVRIALAQKSKEGTNLSRADFPKSEWISRGVVQPMPQYDFGVYDSMRSKPTLTEKTMYEFRKERDSPPLNSVLPSILEEQLEGEELTQWLNSKLEVCYVLAFVILL